MTSAWDRLSMPAPLGREDLPSSELPPPGAVPPDSSERRSPGRTNGAAAGSPPVPAAEPEPHLASALQAAAAARARTARIRAAQPQGSAPRAPQGTPQRLAQWLRASAAGPPADPGPQPWRSITDSAPEVAAAARSCGLSVAAAARASTVAFRPLPHDPGALARAGSPALPAATTEAAAPRAPEPEPVTNRQATLGPAQRQQRFARTIAALERYQAASHERAPDGQPEAGIVPRPVLRPPESGKATGSPWSRLWPLRRDAAAE